jgi:DNA polymerase III alpha subunit (gram-positive type)
MSFNQQSIVVFGHDYETTGLKVQELGVIQSALLMATLHQDGSYEILDQDVNLLNPGVPIEAEASAIHGYTDLDVMGKPDWLPFLRSEMKTINEHDYQAVVSFNGACFDNQIAIRAGWKPNRSVDLYKGASKIKKAGLWEAANLGYSYERLLGKPLAKAHDALADVIGTLDMIAPMMRLVNEKGLADCTSLDQLHKWMQGDDGTPDMKLSWGTKHKGKKIRHIPDDYLRWIISEKCEMTISFELDQAIRLQLGLIKPEDAV